MGRRGHQKQRKELFYIGKKKGAPKEPVVTSLDAMDKKIAEKEQMRQAIAHYNALQQIISERQAKRVAKYLASQEKERERLTANSSANETDQDE